MAKKPDFKKIATQIFNQRLKLLVLLGITTLFLGYQALQLEVATDFARMIPTGHDYMKGYEPYKEDFGSGNQLKIEVSLKEGTIVSYEYLKKLRMIEEDVMFVKGVDRRMVKSLVSPKTIYSTVNEEGFDMGPVVPEIIPETKEGLDQIKVNIDLAALKMMGVVSMDLKSALITAEVYETGVDYLSVYTQLNEIRDKYTDENLSVHINGFAMVMGFVNDALPKILGLFLLATIITFLILWRCFSQVKLAILPLISGGIAVLWSLGIARLAGMKLDPMTTIVPFLVFAIGASHGIQMIKRYLEECAIHPDGYNAALHSLAGLLLPGSVALSTDVIGFLTILFVPIGVIQDLAIVSSVGVGCVIIANIVALTLTLSYFTKAVKCGMSEEEKQSFLFRGLGTISKLTYGENAKKVIIISAILLLIGIITANDMRVGDINPGEPLLWEDSVYNTDAAKIEKDFLFGSDYLSIVVAGEEQGTCYDYGNLLVMDKFETELSKTPGVSMIQSPLMICKMVNMFMHEGNIRWAEFPKTRRDIAFMLGMTASRAEIETMNQGCEFMSHKIILTDHKGDTIRNVVKKAKEFIAANPFPDETVKFVLAGGNAGVMAATNEEVASAQFPMLLLIYLSIAILCLIVFRRIMAPIFIVAPLFMVSVLATAFMKLFGLGLNVNTLPVASLGVGIGVDYGIYIYSRLKLEMKRTNNFETAVATTLQTTGMAVLYTALTLAVGVLTWVLSDLKFQADMGLLLGFIFIANMIAAMVLMPALMYFFRYRNKGA